MSYKVEMTDWGPLIIEDSEAPDVKEERICDGKHCSNCLCYGFCDLRDALEDDEDRYI